MPFYFEILFSGGGSLNLLPFIVEGGLKWSRNDVDSDESGRLMNVEMDRQRLGVKTRWDVSLRPLHTNEVMPILQAILPEFITMHVTDPLYGERTVEFYSNNVPATGATIYEDGEAEWEGITFPLIEK